MSLSAAAPARSEAFVPYSLVAIGGSAGAIGALRHVLARLPASFPLPIVVVQHLSAAFKSRLPEVLNFRAQLRCQWSTDGEVPRSGHIYVARPGTNLVLGRAGRLLHLDGTKPKLGWPSIDMFLHSMAAQLGPQAIGVILSGMLYDGADGIAALRRSGGATMVQHPRTADHPDMPSAAVDLGRADLMLPLEQIAEAIMILAECGVR